jgi:proline racemase
MAEKLAYARQEMDGLRALLMHEPRGRQDMYGALLTEPSNPAADFGLIFLNTQQYTTMCGHAVIGTATSIIETGMLPDGKLLDGRGERSVVFDTPVGLVPARCLVDGVRVLAVSFQNTPVFVYERGASISLPDLGSVSVDVVYSGGFFALVDVQRFGLDLVPRNADALAELGVNLRRAANAQLQVRHPEQPHVTTVDGIEFHEPVQYLTDGSLLARNVASFGDRTIDRSPCGTGTCARMALLYFGGELELGQRFVSESIISTRFTGSILRETSVAASPAVIPEVTGRAHITGFHRFVLDPDDPFPAGFSLVGQQVEGASSS